MAFKPVSVGNVIDIKKQGSDEPLVGNFVGHKEITTKIGKQVIWQFTDEEGAGFGVYGFTNLNRCLENAAVGKLYRITYQGTKNILTKFGKKDVHQVLVEVDEEEKPDSHDESEIAFY